MDLQSDDFWFLGRGAQPKTSSAFTWPWVSVFEETGIRSRTTHIISPPNLEEANEFNNHDNTTQSSERNNITIDSTKRYTRDKRLKQSSIEHTRNMYPQTTSTPATPERQGFLSKSTAHIPNSSPGGPETAATYSRITWARQHTLVSWWSMVGAKHGALYNQSLDTKQTNICNLLRQL
ncbi:hypothetical protein DL98DRAFT_576181 [Cadophora sp. DSE1049]|nr:hypothetical protein DL98DRAFT_576181 [Cadophora sp. DSE1049]